MATPTDKVNEAIGKSAEAVQGAVTTAADKTSRAVGKAKVIAEEAIDNGHDALEGALICAKDMVRANPIATVAVVAAVAYLLGRVRK